jgi:hypothetical protein
MAGILCDICKTRPATVEVTVLENGIKKFLQQQEEKYNCSKCGGVICVHNGKCYYPLP